MRKLLSALIILSLMLTVQASLAEDIIVLSSPDTQESKAVGSLDDMTLNAEVDLGDRIYTLYKANVTKNIAYSNDYPIEGSDVSSVAAVWVRVFNFANKDQSFFKDANGVFYAAFPLGFSDLRRQDHCVIVVRPGSIIFVKIGIYPVLVCHNDLFAIVTNYNGRYTAKVVKSVIVDFYPLRFSS